jgi:hypothetical protein
VTKLITLTRFHPRVPVVVAVRAVVRLEPVLWGDGEMGPWWGGPPFKGYSDNSYGTRIFLVGGKAARVVVGEHYLRVRSLIDPYDPDVANLHDRDDEAAMLETLAARDRERARIVALLASDILDDAAPGS